MHILNTNMHLMTVLWQEPWCSEFDAKKQNLAFLKMLYLFKEILNENIKFDRYSCLKDPTKMKGSLFALFITQGTVRQKKIFQKIWSRWTNPLNIFFSLHIFYIAGGQEHVEQVPRGGGEATSYSGGPGIRLRLRNHRQLDPVTSSSIPVTSSAIFVMSSKIMLTSP